MSQQHTELLSCPRCGGRSGFTVWDSLNVREEPELKEKVLDGSLFRWTCPHCGHEIVFAYKTLYHDPDKRCMLFFEHDEKTFQNAENLLPKTKEFDTYRLRYVSGLPALKEKIFVFDEGLSDIAVELLKYFAREGVIQVQGRRPDYFRDKTLYFASLSEDREQLVFAVIGSDGRWLSDFAVERNLYDQCYQKLLLDERFKTTRCILNVGPAWIESRLKA